jgi:hypothetical protein
LRRPRNVTLHPKISVQGTTRKENDVESTFVFHGIKSAQFLNPQDFYSSLPKEVGLTKDLRDPWGLKSSQPINFNYELLYF